jgi:unsaturated rhamnogalacturonyl hydrolase
MTMTQHKPQATAPAQPWSVRMADSVMRRNIPFRWHYEYGLVHRAIEHVWQKSGVAAYYDYIKREVDALMSPDGSIRGYDVSEYNLDQISAGRTLFMLQRVTGDDKYTRAIHLLRSQLKTQPRNHEHGFWHKQIYPYQMWLDGIYMASPFYAEYARSFAEPDAFDDVAHQITLIEKHTRDTTTGLLYHAWDESKHMPWADPVTGCSPHTWGRALGWYAMAIVDVLDQLPAHHPRRLDILACFERLMPAVMNVQDTSSGLWYQVLDQGSRAGNYLEASCSCMFVYTLAKAVRQGLLDKSYLMAARKGYQGIINTFIRVDEQGMVNLERVCGAAGLGGVPYRDGSYSYYVNEKIVTNDYKGVGPFILASLEMETAT